MSRTPETDSSKKPHAEPLRFVVLHHKMPPTPPSSLGGRQTHWDFMLEEKETLATWALESAPDRLDMEISCMQLSPHRKHYLDYEGPVSGGRGSVVRYDAGTFTWRERTPSRIVVLLEGNKLNCEVELIARSDEWAFVAKAS